MDVLSHPFRLCFICALMLIGALAACTEIAAPIIVPTLTLIPATATLTPTPITPSPLPPASATPLPATAAPTPPPIRTILETTVTPDADLTRRIMRDLASYLNTDVSQVQLVTIEAAAWFDDNLGCDAQTTLDVRDALSTFRPGERVTGFRYVLLVGNTAHEYHTEGLRRFERCLSTEHITGDLLLAVDPVAADMVALVQRQLANELDLSTRRVQLVSVAAYTWKDTSLGCPQPDQTYPLAAIAGYRIVVTVGGIDYAYHSDSTAAIRCPEGQEVLGE